MIEQATVTLTTEALSQLRSLLEKEANPEIGLRVFVSGGGCSGLQYGMAFDDNVRPGDEIVDQDGVRVLIDDFSAPYLQGSEIDYVDSLMGRASRSTTRTRCARAPAATRSTRAKTPAPRSPAAAGTNRPVQQTTPREGLASRPVLSSF